MILISRLKTAVNLPSCRERILQAAMDALAEEGHQVSVDRIAARAGVSKQTLYNHFGSKEDLHAEIGTHFADSFLIALDDLGSDLRGALLRFGANLRKRTLADRPIAIFRAFLGAGAHGSPEHSAIRAQLISRMDKRMSSLLSDAMARGQLRRADPRFVAEMLFAMLLDGDRMRRLAGAPAWSAREEQQRLKCIVDAFLAAFQPDDSQKQTRS